MKIAFVHEYLNQFGGAERVLRILCDLFPEAPIFTLIYDKDSTKGIFEGRTIYTSFLQNLPFSKSHHKFFPALMPLAIEQFDFSDYDVVLSISASFAKGIITKPGTKHICYCLTPPRFLWDSSQKFVEEFSYPGVIKKIIPPLISYLRVWDLGASYRPDEFLTISKFIKNRVKKYYNRDSNIIYPPVDMDRFSISDKKGDHFLMVGRLVSYKKFDLAVRVFNKNGLRLKIAGTGPELKKLKKIAKKNIEFLGYVSDNELAELYKGSKAVIFPQEEDFGIVPLEAMASGKPVIAFKEGGAAETILAGKTGIFFDKQDEKSLASAVSEFSKMNFSPEECRRRAEKFNIANFKNNVIKALSSNK